MSHTPTPKPPSFLDRSLDVHRKIKAPQALVALVVFLTFVTAGLTAESNFGTAGPGPVFVVSGAVSGPNVVDEGAGEGEGRFSLTTVEVKRVSTLRVLWSNVTGRQLVSLDQTAASAVGQMQDAKRDAARAAHIYLNTDVAFLDATAVVVRDVAAGSVAADAGLEVEDRIVAVNSEPVPETDSLQFVLNRLAGADAGTVSITVMSSEGQRDVTLSTSATSSGLTLTTSTASNDSSGLAFSTGVVGGPSAGLMMALAFVDAMSPGDLTAGLNVAGTGTITASGGVGPIAGIEYKLPAALNAGNDVFFVPDTNIDDFGDETFKPMQLVVVTNLQTAIDWLCSNGATDAVCTMNR